MNALLSLREDRLADAYVNGEIDADGSFPDLLKLRRVMTYSHGLEWLARFLAPLLRGQRAANEVASGGTTSSTPSSI